MCKFLVELVGVNLILLTTTFAQDKVKSVQLGKTLSFVKFVVGGTLDCSSLTLKRPTYNMLASCYA